MENPREEIVVYIETENLNDSLGNVIHGNVWQAENVGMGPRSVVRQDATKRQIVPYVVVRDNDGYLFVYQRTKTSGEERLHGNYSVGLGGHVNDVDCVYLEDGTLDVADTILRGTKRELYEEAGIVVDLEIADIVNPLAYLCLNNNHVNSTHLGLVYLIKQDTVHLVEDQLLEMGFKSIDELRDMKSVEDWSKMLVDTEVLPDAIISKETC